MFASLKGTMPADLVYEIIFVDDGSSDGTRNWLSSLADTEVKVLLNEKNLGYAGTNNRGARAARGEYLALLNNDLVLQPQWIQPMLAVFQRRGPGVGVVGNIQRNATTAAVDHAGISVTINGKLEHIRGIPATSDEDQEVLAVTAACCVIRRDLFLEVGCFDEAFRNGGEDVDLAFRLGSRGKRAFIALGSCVRHHVSATRGPTSLQDERNSRLLFQRWSAVITEAIAKEWIAIFASERHLSWKDKFQLQAYTRGWTNQQPQRARLLAQSALWREESRWRQLLDGRSSFPLDVRVCFRGLLISASGSPRFLHNLASLFLPSGFPVRNFFLCGYLTRANALATANARPLGLRVTINGIQTIEWFPLPEGNFNLEINAPASLPDRTTQIRIEILGIGLLPLLQHLAWLFCWLPMPSTWKANLDAIRKHHLRKRLRISRIICDDQCVLNFTEEASTQKSS